MALKIKVNDSHFQYQPRVYQDGYLVILVKKFSCRQGKVYKQMDRRTGAGNDNTPSASKTKG